MLKLYGFAVSNYYNMVKLVLLEKGLEFETVNVFGKQDEAFKAVSPRGKVPCLETPEGIITETSVIVEYLEECYPAPALLPSHPQARAYVRSLMREIELYIELAARPCYPKAFFGGPLDASIAARSQLELTEGIRAFKRHAQFAPYVAGSEFTLADVYLLYSLDLAVGVSSRVFGEDLLADWPQARNWLALMGQNPHVQKIAKDKDTELKNYLEAKRQGLA